VDAIDMGSSASQGKPIQYTFNGQVHEVPDFFGDVEFENEPFQHGAFREAYRGKVSIDSGIPDALVDHSVMRQLGNCWSRSGSDTYYTCVVKLFRRGYAMHAEAWAPDLRALQKAAQLARAFNSEFNANTQIEFAVAFLYEISRCGRRSCPGRFRPPRGKQAKLKERICVEPHLDGDFQKLNSNTGFVFLGTEERYDIAQAFSHWSWIQTERRLLVCDLQGVFKNDKWLFTDPVIHTSCSESRFGITDLKDRGINAFFRTHTCNRFCAGLPKPETFVDSGLEAARRTTFSFEHVGVSTAVHHQIPGTCYAHATATVIRAAESRIFGRRVEEHNAMVKRIIDQHGSNGGNETIVFEEECPPRKLRYKSLNIQGAEEGIRIGRPVYMAFLLTHEQWQQFLSFFTINPNGVLTSDIISPASWRSSLFDSEGHAVVIVGQEADSWKIKNSWGSNWAEGGFFKVKKDALAGYTTRYYDVFFYESDLTEADRMAYLRRQREGGMHTIDE
jgi:hypothetical protein